MARSPQSERSAAQKASQYALKKRDYGRVLIALAARTNEDIRVIHEQPQAAMSGVRSLADTARKRHMRYWGRRGINVIEERRARADAENAS